MTRFSPRHQTRLSPSTFFASAGLVAVVAGCGSPAPVEKAKQGTTDLIGGNQDIAGDSASLIYVGGNGNTCTGARVSPTQILTAAHCVEGDNGAGRGTGTVDPSFQAHQYLTVSRDVVQDGSASSDPYEIAHTDIHGGWTAACAVAGCDRDQSLHPAWQADPVSGGMVAGFAPDVAIITLAEPLPASWPTGTVDLQPVPPGTPVVVAGYGCEASVDTPNGSTARYKINYEQVLDVSAINTPYPNVTPDALGPFGSSYILTPGADLDHSQGASLCPGDSGGPLYRSDFPDTNRIVGVNAYYTFAHAGGVSYTNIHTRLGNGDAPYSVASWLTNRLIDASVLQ